MTAREHDAIVGAVLAHLATQPTMTAVPFTLAAVTYQERTEGKRRQCLARRAYEEAHTLLAEAFCRLGERSMARQR